MTKRETDVTANELTPLVLNLTTRYDTLAKAQDQLQAEHKTTVQALNDCRRELEKEVALLKRDVEELKTRRDVWGGRLSPRL